MDGLAITDHGCKAYEFNGDRFHKNCPFCGTETDPRWDQKIADIKNAGYELEVIWECQFDKFFDRLGYRETPHFPQILKRKTSERELLEGIENGNLFGFILCDISTPQNLISDFKMFPPIIRKYVIKDDNLTDYTKSRVRHEKPELQKFERETLIQSYHAEKILLMTPLARFYLKKGLQISNVEKFIQYIPSHALNPFASHVTRMRIEAEKSLLYTKGATAKVFGNSSYGKVFFYF